jgi:hypothetical protein
MAVIVSFESHPLRRPKLQPTQVAAYWSTFSADNGKRILQIDTRGSADRENVNKQSQTLQLTEESARALWELLGREFKL